MNWCFKFFRIVRFPVPCSFLRGLYGLLGHRILAGTVFALAATGEALYPFDNTLQAVRNNHVVEVILHLVHLAITFWATGVLFSSFIIVFEAYDYAVDIFVNSF